MCSSAAIARQSLVTAANLTWTSEGYATQCLAERRRHCLPVAQTAEIELVSAG
jgi:hypothetical protein